MLIQQRQRLRRAAMNKSPISPISQGSAVSRIQGDSRGEKVKNKRPTWCLLPKQRPGETKSSVFSLSLLTRVDKRDELRLYIENSFCTPAGVPRECWAPVLKSTCLQGLPLRAWNESGSLKDLWDAFEIWLPSTHVNLPSTSVLCGAARLRMVRPGSVSLWMALLPCLLL